MGGLVGRSVRPRVTGCLHREQVGLTYVGDGDHRVVLGRLQNGETAGRVDRGRLQTGCAQQGDQFAVPVDDRLPYPGWNAACAGTRSSGRAWVAASAGPAMPTANATAANSVRARVILRIRVLSVTPDRSANRRLDRTPRLPLIGLVDGQRSLKTTTLRSACGSRLLPGASTTTDSGGAEVNAPGMRIGPPARVALARRIPESRPGALGRDHC